MVRCRAHRMRHRRLALLSGPALAGLLAAPALAQTPQPEPKPATGIDWKDLTKSGIPIRFYGFFRLDAYYNTARANSVILPFVVLPENGTTAKPNDDQFFLDPRLTRLGVDVLPGEVGGTKVSGKLEIDFANFPSGTTESRATPRIRLAYVDVGNDGLTLRAGQDWDVISPLFPTVHGELLMWNAGNLGDRRAQIQGRYAPKESCFDLRASLGLTGAIKGENLDPTVSGVSSEVDGFDSGMPHLQVRAGCKRDLLVENKPAELGLWGAIGQAETDTAFGGRTRFDVWTVGGDVSLPLCPSLTLRGEAWVGENLGDFRGGIGQTINTARGEEIGSVGGWGELVWAATAKTRFHVGAAVDDPDNDEVPANNPKRNLTGYAGTVVDWDSGLRTGFDVLYWETDWVGLGIGNMVRCNLYFQYNF
jgi:hypothetical protein